MLRMDQVMTAFDIFGICWLPSRLICTKTGFPICRIKSFAAEFFDGFAGQRLNRYLAYFGAEKWRPGYF